MIPVPLRGLMRMIALASQLPAFTFNRKLYGSLIREVKNGSPITSAEGEPKVEFTAGPVDGTLGEFDHRTMRIKIDALEVFLSSLRSQPRSHVEAKQAFDLELTRVLAHEGGHYNLQKRHGMIVIVEKLAIAFGLLAVGIGLTFLGWYGVISFVGGFVRQVMANGGVFQNILTLVLYLLLILFCMKIAGRFLNIWRVVSFWLTYNICYHERYARAFEKRTGEDPRWSDVIEVE